MTGRIRTYRIITPPPWERIGLREDPRSRIEEIIDEVAARHTPAHVPPDQIAPKKRELVETLMKQVREASDHGGIDLYLPLAEIHGHAVQASFLVSEVTANALLASDEVPDVMASLLTDAGAAPVTIDDTIWVRQERHQPPTDQFPVESRRVEYVTAVPGAERYWIMTAFSIAGPPVTIDEVPGGVDLLVALFDAMMTTWRWIYDTDTAPT